VEQLLEKHQIWFILSFRFIYGIRTATPFILGATHVKASLFLVLNAIGALLWAVAIGHLGFYLGGTLEATLGRVKEYEFIVVGLLAGGAVTLWVVRFLWRR
jgi:membrane protein DedA with SNARE-associated domain